MHKFKCIHILLFSILFCSIYSARGNCSSIYNIQLSPPSPNTLAFGERVEIAFDYLNDSSGTVLIFARPFTNEELTPYYSAHGSKYYPVGSGSASAFFTINSGEVTVDQIRFQMLNQNQSQVILEEFQPVQYHFRSFDSAGDVAPLGNPDGVVTVADALVCLRFALDLETPSQADIQNGDVAPLDAANQPDPDGLITVADALVILRKALGLVTF